MQHHVADADLAPMVRRIAEVTIHTYFYFVVTEFLKNTDYIALYTSEVRQSVLALNWWRRLPGMLQKSQIRDAC